MSSSSLNNQTLPFATRLARSIARTGSILCAGFDPTLEQIPDFFSAPHKAAVSTEEYLFQVLRDYYTAALAVIADKVGCIKPNIAFFEQFGIGGLRALQVISNTAAERGIPVILDAKRGDIASTAEAYCRAYLQPHQAHGRPIDQIHADALTMNPFLGFDTVRTFLSVCKDNGRGLFVLVKTSNPGSADIQGLRTQGEFHGGKNAEQNAPSSAPLVMERIGQLLHTEGEALRGENGFSGLGAVVGATYPDEARALRAIMPDTLFLIPGYGSQGGAASDAVSGFCPRRASGGIVNISRGLFGLPKDFRGGLPEFQQLLTERLDRSNAELTGELQSLRSNS